MAYQKETASTQQEITELRTYRREITDPAEIAEVRAYMEFLRDRLHIENLIASEHAAEQATAAAPAAAEVI